MTTHRDIASTETDPQAPITAALMKALDANLDATAEGALNAPKVRGEALDLMLPLLTVSGTTPQEWLDLDRAEWLELDFYLSGGGATVGNLQYAVSSDNGATWGSYIAVGTILGTITANPTAYGSFRMNLKTGERRGYEIRISNTSVPSHNFVTSTSAPAGTPNAIRFRLSSSGDLKVDGKIIGGVSP